MLHAQFEINQYVIFKYQDEWQEGRIVEAVASDSNENSNRIYYKIISFSTLQEVPTLIYDHIVHHNLENLKKVKMSPDKIVINKEIKGILECDKLKASLNKIYKGDKNMGHIFNDFAEFLQGPTKCCLTKEEIILNVEGLKYIFNQLVGRVLMSSREYKYFDNLKRRMAKKGDILPYYQSFGLIYGIRVVYYVLKDFLEEIADLEIRFCVFEFIIYFLDFISFNLTKYYDVKFYE